MSKKAKQIVFPITSIEQWEAITSPEKKQLVVIDVHLTWCGPCTVMEQSFRGLYFNITDAEKRVEFYTLEET